MNNECKIQVYLMTSSQVIPLEEINLEYKMYSQTRYGATFT